MPKSTTSVSLGDHDVFGLDVAMHDTVSVGMRDAVDDVPQQARRLGNRERFTPRQPAAERLAFHERHHVVEKYGGFTRIDQGEDVGVL
jgi:hypothetical protein